MKKRFVVKLNNTAIIVKLKPDKNTGAKLGIKEKNM